VPVPRIRVGQLWRYNQTGETYLVTRIYDELFSTYAVLRKVNNVGVSETRRVKVRKTPEGMSLEGFTFTQEEQRSP